MSKSKIEKLRNKLKPGSMYKLYNCNKDVLLNWFIYVSDSPLQFKNRVSIVVLSHYGIHWAEIHPGDTLEEY